APAPAPAPEPEPTPEPVAEPAAEPAPAPAAETTGTDAIASGTQAVVTAEVPVTVTDNAVSVLGSSAVDSPASASDSGESVPSGDETPQAPAVQTSGLDSILGGTQALLDVDVPVTVTGNAISVLGTSAVTGGAAQAPTAATGGDAVTSGVDSILGGAQVVAPVSIPLTIGGNAIAVVGESTVTDSGTAPTDPGTDP